KTHYNAFSREECNYKGAHASLLLLNTPQLHSAHTVELISSNQPTNESTQHISSITGIPLISFCVSFSAHNQPHAHLCSHTHASKIAQNSSVGVDTQPG